MRATFAAIAGLAAISAASADEIAIPPQRHPPDLCSGRPVCLRQWFGEYRDGLLAELKVWRSFEAVLAVGDETSADHSIGTLIREGQYRHNSWDFYKGGHIDGVDDGQLDTLVVDCRAAIIDLKFMLIDLGDGRPLKQADVDEYLNDVGPCEKTFNLPEIDSPLRHAPAVAAPAR